MYNLYIRSVVHIFKVLLVTFIICTRFDIISFTNNMMTLLISEAQSKLDTEVNT